MSRRYYSARNSSQPIQLESLYLKLKALFLYFREKDYFKGEAGISSYEVPDSILYRAELSLDFQPFPVESWDTNKITETNIFDTIEFLFDFISKPGEWGEMASETGFIYSDYYDYDKEAGKLEFIEFVNPILEKYREGYELTPDGRILSLGSREISDLIRAELPNIGIVEVDKKVRLAIIKWRNRELDLETRRSAVNDLADLFEWLRDSGELQKIAMKKDESDLFNIANNFAIRHHNRKQKGNYDKDIWYSWMFHFYLATYHAISRMIERSNL